MCGGFENQDVTTASSASAPAWLQQFYKDNANELTQQYNTAKNIYNANNTYQPYTGSRQQGFVNDQSQAMQMVRDNVGLGQDQLQNAQKSLNRGATSYTDNMPMTADSVSQMYQAYLGRTPSASEIQHQLKNNTSITSLRDNIANSGEASQRLAAGYKPDLTKVQDGTFRPGAVQTENYNQSYQQGGITPQYAQITTNTGKAPLIGTDQSAQQGGFDTAQAQKFMNPYTDTVMKNTLAEIDRQNQKGVMSDAARASAAKAFGGSRHGVVEGERARNNSQLKADTIGSLMNQNYAQAQGQYNTQAGLNQQNNQFNAGTAQGAQMANQNAIMTTLMGDQQALNTGHQFNSSMGVNAQLANEGLRQTAFGMNRDTFNQNQDRNFATQVQNQNMGLQAFNANRDQLNTDLNRAIQTGGLNMQLGAQAQNMGMQDANNVLTIGNMQQQFGQQGLDIAYQDFLRQKMQPYENFAFLQNALQGKNYTPNVGQNTTSTQSGGGQSTVSQLAGLGIAGLGAYSAFG